MYKKILCVCLFTTIITSVLSQDDETAAKTCHQQTTCGSCIAAGAKCGWCTQEGYDSGNKRRCDILENLVSLGCEYSFIKKPDHEVTFDQDLDVRNAEDGKEAIQLKPQEITLKLRPNKPYKFNMTFRQAENYPVDLYYVMDLSFSMGDDKSKLAELGDLLAESMSEITTNFRLGFGSFVDKKTMPYVSMIPEKLISPCSGCAAPYGFHNQLRLTDDTSQFRTKVMAAPISGNLDSPEGGFDAIMQAISCTQDIGWRDNSRKLLVFATDADSHYAGDGKTEIGWRENSRKMLLFSTDAGFHYAGDGKLGGIVKPNDGRCHLDNAGYYSESLNQDYPSISQISNKITDNKVSVIFAVTGNQVDTYKELSTFIESSVVGELANDSSNVVTLVRENYEKITSLVKLNVEGNEGVDVSFRTKCFGKRRFSNETIETAQCKGLGIGQNVTFEVSIEVTECPTNREEWKKNIKIHPVGLTEALMINLEMICECDCELPSQEVKNSPRCNNSGTFECGACTCHGKHYGKNCECDGSEQQGEDYNAACKATNTSEVCEGRGVCVCGSCDCNPISTSDPNKRYSGTFCECDDYSCDYFENQLCGGPERGVCNCGVCVCKKNYNGTACDCPISQESCIAENGELCNGKGTCSCGRCTCHKDTYYRGPTCEDCPTCTGKCDANKACVQCRAFQTGPIEFEGDCIANCSHVTLVDSVEETKTRKLCTFQDDDGCMFYFAYEYDSDRVYAQKTKECQEKIKLWWIILAIILAILLIGIILLLIWKCCATLIDRREFAKFEKERQNAKWDTGENPIYKQATTTFNNPTYKGKN